MTRRSEQEVSPGTLQGIEGDSQPKKQRKAARVLGKQSITEAQANPERPYVKLDTKLKEHFADWVVNIDLPSVVRLAEGARMPKGLDNYLLVPLLAKDMNGAAAIVRVHEIQPPEQAEFHQLADGYVESLTAIGLAFKGKVAAVGSASVTKSKTIFIKQLQALLPRSPDDPQARYASGLYGGFLWRDTLVQAWIEVAGKLEINKVELQSGGNNPWIYKKPWIYDDVAERMGFEFNDRTENWYLRLGPAEKEQ